MIREEARDAIMDAFGNSEYTDELIKALEQEPKTGHWLFDDKCKEHGHCPNCGYGSVDLVDGEPHNYCPKCGFCMVESQESKIEEWLKELKQLREQTRWIPVSERDPKKSGNYWCTFGGTNLTGSDYYTTEGDAKELYDDPEEYAGWQSQNVVAWMPLPKSYKIESEAELGHNSENELVCQDIKELPPATPQPKTGHWIDLD